MSFYHNHGGRYRHPLEEPSFDKEGLDGYSAALAEATLPTVRSEEEIRRAIEMGLEAAPSIGDRTISCFSRGELPHWAGINTFLKMPYLENVHEVGQYDIAILGAPFDIGTTYRAGTRFGPQAIRRISALYTTYNYELGVDLREQVKICDLGDVFTVANIEKSFDQITKAVSHVMSKGTMPIILGGDHAIGYPCLRGVAENVDGNVGIIHRLGFMPPTFRTLQPRTWFRSGSAVGRYPGPGLRWPGTGERRFSPSMMSRTWGSRKRRRSPWKLLGKGRKPYISVLISTLWTRGSCRAPAGRNREDSYPGRR